MKKYVAEKLSIQMRHKRNKIARNSMENSKSCVVVDVHSSFEEYVVELRSGRLCWSPLHTSDKFWTENAHRLMAKKAELLRYK